MKWTNKLKETGDFSDYEIDVIKYVLRSLSSEISKIILFAVIWSYQNQTLEFFFCFLLFSILRIKSGGIHLNGYISCLLFSYFYFTLCLDILPLISLEKWCKLSLLLICIIIAYYCAPIVSKYRHTPSLERQKKSKLQLFIIIFIYLLVMFILPSYPILDVGFWCIMLHTIQLYIAYIVERRKKHV